MRTLEQAKRAIKYELHYAQTSLVYFTIDPTAGAIDFVSKVATRIGKRALAAGYVPQETKTQTTRIQRDLLHLSNDAITLFEDANHTPDMQ